MSDKNQSIKVEASEKHIMDFSMYAATRIDISNLDAKIDRNSERFDQQIKRLEDKIEASISRLDKKIDSNFKWTLGLLIPIMLSGFAGLYYKDMNNSPSTQSPHLATVQQK